jgi:hypothetical protein
MTQFEDVLETILEEYARRDSEGEFDTWEETDAFVKEKAEVLLAYVKEEPVSEPIDFEQELYKAFGQVKDFTLGMRIAKWFYDMGKNRQKPVSEEFDEEIEKLYEVNKQKCDYLTFDSIARHFANWQKQKIIDKTCEYLRLNLCNYFDGTRDEYGRFIINLRKAMEE